MNFQIIGSDFDSLTNLMELWGHYFTHSLLSHEMQNKQLNGSPMTP